MSLTIPAASHATPHSSPRLSLKEQLFCFFLGLRATLPAFMCPKKQAMKSSGHDSDGDQNSEIQGESKEGSGESLLKPSCFGVQLLGKDSREFIPSKALRLSKKSWM